MCRRTLITALDSPTEERSDSTLYTDFASDVRWVKDRIRSDLQMLPLAMQGVARHYVAQRVKVLHAQDFSSPTHPLSPRPIPYFAFWFAEAFGLRDAERRFLGLSLAYVVLSSSPRDDLADGSDFAPYELSYLAAWFWERHFCAFKRLFPRESPIWYLLAKSTADWGRSERWELCQDGETTADPFSAASLLHASRYLAAMTFPTLAGAALLRDEAKKLRAVKRFVCNYCMGWRILDDLRDWREDLEANTASSCILTFMRKRARLPKGEPLTRELGVSLLTDEAVVSEIYSAMTKFCLAARREADRLRASFVTEFIDEQLLGYDAELKRIRAEKVKFKNSLAQLLELDAGASKRVPNPHPREKPARGGKA